MECRSGSGRGSGVDLASLFSDLVRLEIELWDRIDQRLRRDHELPLSWFEPMQVIDRVSDCRVGDIADELSITAGGTSKLVDRIEQTGWCERTPNPDDARSSLIHLTRAGRRLLATAERTLEEELEMSLGAALSTERLESLASALRVARQRLADQHGSAR